MQARFKRLETFHTGLPEGVDTEYANSHPNNHGTNGALHVGYAGQWEKDIIPVLDVFKQAGFPLNPDHNSGNPLGMVVLINSACNGLRTTAADLLTPRPEI